VIGSDLGNTGSLVVDGVSGFKFSPSSAEALAEAVRNLEEGFDGLGTDIVEKYSSENNYQRLREIYEACCNHH
jgi:glycosyltransferase involved in cell wall biosynthesis